MDTEQGRTEAFYSLSDSLAKRIPFPGIEQTGVSWEMIHASQLTLRVNFRYCHHVFLTPSSFRSVARCIMSLRHVAYRNSLRRPVISSMLWSRVLRLVFGNWTLRMRFVQAASRPENFHPFVIQSSISRTTRGL